MSENGAVLVVGGGIAGVQASLDLAEAGIKVYLVERSPSVGGRMAQLDKTFPTNDCSICISSPKLVAVGRHPNIELLTLSELIRLGGDSPNFKAVIRKRARYVSLEKCIGCGMCAQKCPKKVPSEFEVGMVNRKAVYIPFPQAVPLKYTIDPEHCIKLIKDKCGVCEKVCPAEAIDFQDKDEEIELNISSVIVATGFDQAMPSRPEYGYDIYKDVMTGLEFERMLNAAGPTEGHIKVPSTEEEPKKLAFIQCVGSRDRLGREYCSRVCCMYSIKEAMMAREHVPGLDTAIYYMDMRTFGRGFQEYYDRAISEGIRFINGRAAEIVKNENGRLSVIAEDVQTGEILKEDYDMVILASAIVPSNGCRELANVLGIELDANSFFKEAEPGGVESTKKGIFLAGCAQGPKDIPDSVTQASAAASKAMALTPERIKLEWKALPMECGEEKRVGVFVCHCGSNIAGVVDVEAVAEYASKLPGVVYAEHDMFTCSDNTQNKIAEVIKEKRLTRVVVASCSPRTHEPIFRETCAKADLNPYLFEMANIRDQCSWVHMEEKEKATEKAKDLVRMAVARAIELEPLQVEPKDVSQSALVVGGGIAGMTAAIDLKEQGYDVCLVEKDRLGGLLNDISTLSYGINASELVEQRKKRLEDLGVKVVKGEVVGVEGSVGDFQIKLSDGSNYTAGAIVLATGAKVHTPKILGYGQFPNVITSLEFEKRSEQISGNVGFMLCVGANDETNRACSRFCCQVSIKQALQLAESGAHPFVFYKDIRTFQKGGEESYHQAAEKGVKFIQYTERPGFDGKVMMTTAPEKLSIPLDYLVLSVGMEVPDIENLRLMLKVPKGRDGFFLEKHPKLGPVETNTDGIFVAGCASGPKELALSISGANGAAGKAGGLLSKGVIYSEPITSVVDSDRCMGCGVCVPLCPYGAISLSEEGIAEVNFVLCKGCGVCAAACPKMAISMYHFSDSQITAQIESFGGRIKDERRGIV